MKDSSTEFDPADNLLFALIVNIANGYVVGIYPFIKILINLELIGQRLSYNHLKITISTNFRTMGLSLRSFKSISLTPSGSASAQTKTKMT